MKPAKPTPGADAPPLHDEADIGSGEKSPGQHDTDEMIRQIPPLPPSNGAGKAGRNAGEPPKP